MTDQPQPPEKDGARTLHLSEQGEWEGETIYKIVDNDDMLVAENMTKADASRFAAVPDLLAALEALTDAVEADKQATVKQYRLAKDARAAIRKARGGE